MKKLMFVALLATLLTSCSSDKYNIFGFNITIPEKLEKKLPRQISEEDWSFVEAVELYEQEGANNPFKIQLIGLKFFENADSARIATVKESLALESFIVNNMDVGLLYIETTERDGLTFTELYNTKQLYNPGMDAAEETMFYSLAAIKNNMVWVLSISYPVGNDDFVTEAREIVASIQYKPQ